MKAFTPINLICFFLTLVLPSISASGSLSTSTDEPETKCALLRQDARKLIESGKRTEASRVLQETYQLLTNIFDACKVAELFYDMDEPWNAIKALKIASEFKARYKFEVTEAIKLLEERHSGRQADLITKLHRLTPPSH